MRVAVFGASGFVGAAFVEHLSGDSGVEIRPVIHSSGNAARLARLGQPLIMADVMAPDTVARALDGCTHVVNCARGSSDTMIRGLGHLLDASRQAGVQRFIHLSSVAAYGDGHEGLIEESAAAAPANRSYGHTKLRQDELVARAARAGLPAVVLCPPNISGPYSPFLLEIIGSLRRSDFGLVDDGSRRCELIDIGNLVHAIRLALFAGVSDGQRIFVTDGGPVTWAELVRHLAPLADAATSVPSIPFEAARAIVQRTEPAPASFRRALQHVTSAAVREALRRDAWFAQAERGMKSAVRGVPRLERRLRDRFATPEGPHEAQPRVTISPRLLKQQLRGVEYSQERASRLLQYVPPRSFEASMRAFADWYALHHGWRDEWWPLMRHLQTS